MQCIVCVNIHGHMGWSAPWPKARIDQAESRRSVWQNRESASGGFEYQSYPGKGAFQTPGSMIMCMMIGNHQGQT